MSSSRQLAAILFTDIVGYSQMMHADEKKAVALLKHYNTTLEKWVIQPCWPGSQLLWGWEPLHIQ